MGHHPSEWSKVTLGSSPAPEPSFPSIQAGLHVMRFENANNLPEEAQWTALVFVGPVPFTFWQMASLLCPVVLVNISSMDSTPSHVRVGILPSLRHSAYPFSASHTPPPPPPPLANDWFSSLSEAQGGPIEMKEAAAYPLYGENASLISRAWN